MNVVELKGFESSPFTSFLSFFDNLQVSCVNSNKSQIDEDKYIIVARLDGLAYLKSSSEDSKKSKVINALSELDLIALRQNRSVLVLDNSLEGIVFQEQIFEEFYGELNRENIAPENVIILTENLSLSEYHEKWLYLKNYQKGIKVFFYHAFMNWMALAWQKELKLPSSSLIEFQKNQIEEITSLQQKEHHFLFLNNMPKAHRLLTALVLHKEKILSRGLSSFANLKNPNTQLDREINVTASNIEKYYSNNASALSFLSEFIQLTPLIIDGESGSFEFRNNRVTQVKLPLFQKTHFSIVTESESTHGQMVRFTEKCLKPLISFHPFIVIGNPFTLRALQNLGFKTFSPYIDETYDEVPDANLRFDFAMSSILKLATMNKPDLAGLVYKLKSVLEYNFYHAINELPQICRNFHNDVNKYIICRLSDENFISTKNSCLGFQDSNKDNDPKIGVVIVSSNKLLSLSSELNTSKPQLAIISHLNSSGGTVISKCLAAMNKVSLLSEIHPWGCYLSNGNFHPLVQYLKWHDDGTLLELIEKNKDCLISAKFSQIIKILENHASSLGNKLVLRDWSYIDYFNGAGHPIPYKPLLRESLLDTFEIHTVVTTRHPIDTWLSTTASGFANQLSVDKFIFGYWHFARYAQKNRFFKYEDFVIAPNKILSKICSELQIHFDPEYADNWFNYVNITGDSGRKSKTIAPRNRRKIDDKLLKMFESNHYYQEAIAMLGYE